jgi:hypothetical protein
VIVSEVLLTRVFRFAKIWTVTLSILAAYWAEAQVAEDESPDVVYSKEITFGAIAHTRGLGLSFNYARYRGARKTWNLGLDIVNMKHESEIRSFNPFFENSRSYIYGKLNSFFAVRPSFGVTRIIAPKLRNSGVRLGYTYQLGPSLGFTKPIYLEIGYPSGPIFQYVQTEKFDPEKHDFNNIYGRASALLGFGELNFHPGGFGAISIQFEYADTRDRVKGIDLGMAMDAYPQVIPIMAKSFAIDPSTGIGGEVDRNHRMFLTLFLKFYFGSRLVN